MTRGLAAALRCLGRYLRPLGTCGMVGFLAGIVAGTFITIVAMVHEIRAPEGRDVLAVGALLVAATWPIVLFVLTVTGRMTFRSVALPSLVNVTLTIVLTVIVSFYAELADAAWAVGALVGSLVGAGLCRINAAVRRAR